MVEFFDCIHIGLLDKTMDNSAAAMVQSITVMAIPIVLAVVLHEVAHGYVALLRGDRTAQMLGRLTLNPIAHIDPVGTILLPVVLVIVTSQLFGSPFMFAFAKPVPVDYRNLRNPKKDMALVAAAGPVTNIILAVVSALLFNLLLVVGADLPLVDEAGVFTFLGHAATFLAKGLFFSIQINLILALINLIPIPPADGGRIVTGFLPDAQAVAYARIEPYGLMILMTLLFLNPFGIIDYTLIPLLTNLIKLLT
jgi:Zn-dependent protease